MAPRVSSDLLLVGSLPADSTENALRAASDLFGDLVFALPDGETGPRAGWVGYERERLVRPNPGVDTVTETPSPTGLPRHAYETPVFRIRPGVTELRWDSWARIDDAIDSYQVFRGCARTASSRPGCGSRSGCPSRRARSTGSRRTSARTTRSPKRPSKTWWPANCGAWWRRSRPQTSRCSGTSATRCSTSKASWPGPRPARGSASPPLWAW